MLNASSALMSYALEQTNVARIRVICQSASSARHFLLARGQLSTCSPSSLSSIHLVACLYLCPADLNGCSFNSFSKQSCLRTRCSLSPYLCPACCFQENLFKPAGTCQWNKFGSKCDAFVAGMSSRMSAPGTSCSKETVLRIGFMMDHHRDY